MRWGFFVSAFIQSQQLVLPVNKYGREQLLKQ
jgi:hypothetical protein